MHLTPIGGGHLTNSLEVYHPSTPTHFEPARGLVLSITPADFESELILARLRGNGTISCRGLIQVDTLRWCVQQPRLQSCTRCLIMVPCRETGSPPCACSGVHHHHHHANSPLNRDTLRPSSPHICLMHTRGDNCSFQAEPACRSLHTPPRPPLLLLSDDACCAGCSQDVALPRVQSVERWSNCNWSACIGRELHATVYCSSGPRTTRN